MRRVLFTFGSHGVGLLAPPMSYGRADALLAGQRLLLAPGTGGAAARRRRPPADAGDDARQLPALPPRRHIPRRADDGSVGPRRAEPGRGLARAEADGGLHARAAAGAEALARRVRFTPAERLRRPTRRPSSTRPARPRGARRPTAGRRARRGPHALDDFEYFGGQFHCGRPWHPTASRTRCPTARRSRARRAPPRRSRTPSTSATPRSPTTRPAGRS